MKCHTSKACSKINKYTKHIQQCLQSIYSDKHCCLSLLIIFLHRLFIDLYDFTRFKLIFRFRRSKVLLSQGYTESI